jgi:hypothetical protein
MFGKFLGVVSILAALVVVSAPAAVAQQGHPLVGVWSGTWGPSATDQKPVVVEMLWHDTTLSGNINPGETDAATIKLGNLDSSKWTVHLEAEGKDANAPVKIVMDGQIDNLGSAKRTLTGTYMRGTAKGTFKVTRE